MMQVTKVMIRTVMARSMVITKSMTRVFLITLGLGLALMMATPKVNAFQDPQNGGPRVNTPQPGDPQYGNPQAGNQQGGNQQAGNPQAGNPQAGNPQAGNHQGGDQQQGYPQAGSPQDPSQQGEPQDDGVPDDPNYRSPQQPNYSQGNGPQGNGPQGNGPQGSGPQGNGPQGNGPQGGRPDSSSRRDSPQFPSAQSEVARISMLHGDISMQRADTGDWATASLNTPLVRGDQVATGEKSRAEIQLDYANILRLSSRSQAKIADLTRTRIQLQVAQGYANYSMFKGGEADVEIDTPNVSVHPLRTGRYRIQVNSDSETDVIVREGEAEVTTPQGSTTVKKGQQITIRGTNNPEYRVDGAPSKDDWDRFNSERDSEIRDSASWGRTSPYYTGASDLDRHGRWVFIPGYGWVWQPYQDINWAPYQSGRWVYEPYWGWTWVSYEPWGWAPYHYGRWFFYGSSWVWWPGPVSPRYRPIWAPAYVSFIGFGRGVGVGVGFGFGSIGWLPCGPFDSFYPWYGRGFNRVSVVNITNINIRNGGGFAPLGVRGRQPFVSNVNLALTNPRVRAGISGVPAGEFGRGNVQVARLNVREADLRESRMVTGNVPVVPTPESLRVGAESRIGQGGVQPKTNDKFFTRNQPPPAAPAFHEQASQVQRVMQGHVGNTQVGNSPAGNAQVGGGQMPGGNRGSESPRGIGNVGASGNAERNAGPMSSGAPQGGANSAGNSANGSSERNAAERNTGGWTKFGSPSGRANDSGRSNTGPSGPSGPASRDNVRVPNSSNVPSGRSNSGPGTTTSAPSSEDRGGVRRSPGGGNSQPNESTPRSETPRTSGPGGPTGDNVDRNSGGWQRFPANSGSGSTASSGKPTLELNKPIVTPRDSPGPSPSRNDRGGPPPSASPRGGSEPRGGGGSGSHERGGGGGGGDKGSKSNSGSKNR